MDHKTVLITGAGGFIARHLAALIRATYPSARIVGIDNVPIPGTIEFSLQNLLDRQNTARFLDRLRPDFIFHLAGKIYMSSFQELYEGNVATTEHVMAGLLEQNISCRVIIPGSAAEYGNIKSSDLPLVETQVPHPISPYGVSKVWQTELAKYYHQLGVDVVIGRMFNVMGAGMPEGLSLGAFVRQLKRIKSGGLPPILRCGDLRPRRDFIDVEDACRGLLAIARDGQSGEIYNICSGQSHEMGELLDLLARLSSVSVSIETEAERFKRIDIADIFGSNNKIRETTGWTPQIDLPESCRRMLADCMIP